MFYVSPFLPLFEFSLKACPPVTSLVILYILFLPQIFNFHKELESFPIIVRVVGEELFRDNLDKRTCQFHAYSLAHKGKIERIGLKGNIPEKRGKMNEDLDNISGWRGRSILLCGCSG